MGKGDRRYKDRQQCSDDVMELRWKLAFDNELTPDEVLEIIKKIEELGG